MMLVKVALLVVLCSQVILGILNYSLDMLSEMSCIKHLALVTHNDINRQPNLFPIHQLKCRVTCTLCHS